MRKPNTLPAALQLIAVIASLILLTGCIARHGAAEIRTVPPGAEVFDLEDGSAIGVTPLVYNWRSTDTKKKYMNLRVHKAGYRDVVKSFWLNLEHYTADTAASNPQSLTFELKKADQ